MFLRSLAATAAISAVMPRLGIAAKAPVASLSVTRLSPRTVLIAGAGANVVATECSDGLIVIDGGLDAYRSSLLATLAHEFKGAPIAWLFNTHWHREQTGLNEPAGKAGAVVCAHENTKLWLSTEYYVDWQDRTYGPLPPVSRPNRTFYGSAESAVVGGREIEFGRLPNAHTDGDVFVHLNDEDLLAVGGALTPGAYPLMDYSTGGWPDGVIAASRLLMERAGDGTQVVAASGPVLRKSALKTQLDLATVLRERVAAGIKQGKSVQDMLDEGVTKEYDAEYGDPRFFVRSSYQGLWGHIRELGVA